MLSIDFNVGNVVFEHGGDVDLGKMRMRGEKERMYAPRGRCLLRKRSKDRSDEARSQLSKATSQRQKKKPRDTFPQAPSPTMTSFLRISDMDINGLSGGG